VGLSLLSSLSTGIMFTLVSFFNTPVEEVLLGSGHGRPELTPFYVNAFVELYAVLPPYDVEGDAMRTFLIVR
jgi:hypothetical protein